MGCFLTLFFSFRLASQGFLSLCCDDCDEKYCGGVFLGLRNLKIGFGKPDNEWILFSVATVVNVFGLEGPRLIGINWCVSSHHISSHYIHLWLVIQRKLKTQDKLRQWDWWLSSDPMARGSVYDFGYVLRVECQARAVLFFPSPRFFPLSFYWEGFLRRQSQMMSYYPSMQFWVGCGDSCSLKWFLPIGVIVSVVWKLFRYGHVHMRSSGVHSFA
ncbi:hypothetical protein Tco_1328355 [Tanacetum coccineum]